MNDVRESGSVGQLALRMPLDSEATLENFLPGAAGEALCAALAGPIDEPLQFLHGPAAVGKSHLLQASCRLAALGAVYLPLAELATLDPVPLLQDLEHVPLLAVDELQCVAGDVRWEESIFHLVNRCRARSTPLLLAARKPPADLGVRLADLRSRLAGGVIWALPAYGDVERRDILRFRAQRRGLELPEAVLNYIDRRASRSLADLLPLLERLDDASLRAQRPLTVPLVRDVLNG